MKKKITKKVYVEGNFLSIIEREYAITLDVDIDEEVLKEDYDSDIDGYMDDDTSEFEEEAEKLFNEEFDSGKISESEIGEKAKLDYMDSQTD